MYMPNIITAASVSALFLVLFGDGKYGAINSLLLSKEMIVEPIRFITEDQLQNPGYVHPDLDVVRQHHDHAYVRYHGYQPVSV